MYNSDKEVKRKIELPTWSKAEEQAIHDRCEHDTREKEQPYEVTDEMVLDTINMILKLVKELMNLQVNFLLSKLVELL